MRLIAPPYQGMSSQLTFTAALQYTPRRTWSRNSLKLQSTVIFGYGERQDECFVKCGSYVGNRKTVAYLRAEENVDAEDSSIKACAGSEPTTRVDNASPNAS